MSNLIRKSKKGFTLIELMIVVAIIGILAAIAIPNFLRFQLKSKSSEGKVNIAAIRTAEESYLAEFGNYVAAV
ncbi:MAG TPA: prepilin-type N-terminal cleavage/methylation domain-containing protein, partial [Myxococcota bacterium]|nr:prepilin-type N-terminal cleavage/methylation domain-containing protein [Myxococcota bacterium]